MKEARAFLKSSALYLVGGGLSKAVSLLMLPLYTRRVSPEAYGLYDASLAAAALFSSLLYLDIWNGILRFMYDEGDDGAKMRPAAAGGALFLVSSALYCALVAALTPRFGLVNPGWLCLYGCLNALSQATGSVARGLGQNVRYMAAGLLGTLTAAAANLILLLLFRWGYEALYLSACLGYAVTSLVNLLSRRFLGLRRGLRLCGPLLRRVLAFSAPLCLNSAAYWFLTGYSKAAVAGVLSAGDNGLYAVAGKFGLIVTLLSRCFQLAWQELSFGKGRLLHQEQGAFYSAALKAYLRAMPVALAVLLPAVRLLFPVFVSPAYREAYRLAPAVLLGMAMASTSEFLGSVFAALKRTRPLFATTAAGALVNVLALAVGLRRFGVKAAGVALFFGFLTTALFRAALLWRLIGLRVSPRAVAAPLLWLAACLLWYFALSASGNAALLAVAAAAIPVFYRKELAAMRLKLGASKKPYGNFKA